MLEMHVSCQRPVSQISYNSLIYLIRALFKAGRILLCVNDTNKIRNDIFWHKIPDSLSDLLHDLLHD